ncbi:MAG: diaminopimelate epimerase [Fimbriimonadales bacterium]|nr:diaminopimelate epimerase [Fimbriimonadales bacterium]
MIPFTKMHGIGNDFVMLDGLRHPVEESLLPDLARRMCDRRFGIGSDGLILLVAGAQERFRMRMFNPDGSESEMCGNGIRCFVRFLRQKGHASDARLRVETGAGVLALEETPEGHVRVDMGPARLRRAEIPMAGEPDDRFVEEPIEACGRRFLGTAVSMGNPHLVVFVERAAEVPLEEWGPALENHPLFPKRTNVHFVEVESPTRLVQRTWERGAGATLACGTGACACTVAAALTGRAERAVTVRLPGGELRVEWLEDGRVLMTGPAETVFEGTWLPD